MTTRLHIAARSLRGAVSAYAKRFDLLEVAVTVAKGDRADKAAQAKSDPAHSIPGKCRTAVPPHFDFAVVAPPALAALKPGDALERDLSIAQAAIATLRARCFVVHMPTEVTPSGVSRDRLKRLFDRFPRD